VHEEEVEEEEEEEEEEDYGKEEEEASSLGSLHETVFFNFFPPALTKCG
jgi:hypothetical protein